MEALGAVAAIAQLSGLSMRAGKAAKDLIQSFAHAPEEIIELNCKLERLRTLIQQIDILCEGLPDEESLVLLPPEHRMLLMFSLQRTLDSLTSLNSVAQTSEHQGVRERIRWAALDKRKAQRFLKEIRLSESELDIVLQVLSVRLISITKNSISILATSQNSLQAELKQSVNEVKMWISKEISRLEPINGARNYTAIVPKSRTSAVDPSRCRDEEDDPIQRLMEHNARRTIHYHEVTVGSPARGLFSDNGWSSAGIAAMLRRKRTFTKANLLISLGCRLFGESILKFELNISVNCRSYWFQPRVASCFTILNFRPSQSPIFIACRQHNFDEVRYLLQTGEASVRDVDGDTGGLLEHVIVGKFFDDRLCDAEDEFIKDGQRLLEYLLDQGADPSIYLNGERNSRPAILAAFKKGYTAAISSMMSHGADLNDFESQLAGMWENFNDEAAFLWKLRLIRSLGFSDWQSGEYMNNLLYGACWHSHMDLALFALEVACIDPNLTGVLDRAPIGNAAQENWIEGVTVLLEAGARLNISEESWNGTPLHRSVKYKELLTDTGHFLLFQQADPSLYNYRGLTAWSWSWLHIKFPFDGMWTGIISFIRFEGSLAHLLHHNADPFEVFTTTTGINPFGANNRMGWFDEIGYVRAADASRFWSYGIEEKYDDNGSSPEGYRPNLYPEQWKEQMHAAESTRDFECTFCWDHLGNISRVRTDMYDKDENSCALEPISSDDTEHSNIERAGQDNALLGDVDVVSEGESEHDCNEDEDSINGPLCDFLSPSPGFFRNATAFNRHIANKQGRRQLSRFPMVRALCDALQHAGYRAEMDNDGEIWYDCDDGDRYFDSLEVQDTDEDTGVWLSKVCPICQDFEGYGLGHVLKRAESAKKQYYEYKEQVRQGKRTFCV